MIFVILGTHHDPFTRLVTTMDRIAGETSERVIVQRGLTPFEPRHAETFDFRPREEIIERCNEARVVVTHAGIGSIIDALKSAKPLIVVPRLKRHGEHNTDHQLDLAHAVERRNWGRIILDTQDLPAACADPPPAHAIYAPARDPLIAKLRACVEAARAR